MRLTAHSLLYFAYVGFLSLLLVGLEHAGESEFFLLHQAKHQAAPDPLHVLVGNDHLNQLQVVHLLDLVLVRVGELLVDELDLLAAQVES